MPIEMMRNSGRMLRNVLGAMFLCALGAAYVCGQEAQQPPPVPPTPPVAPNPKDTAPAPAEPSMKRAIRWKEFDYTCEGGAKLTVYLRNQMVKVRFKDKAYLMKQVPSADGARYSDGKVVWWGKGNGGFLQNDAPDGNGDMIVKDCKLDKPLGGDPPAGAAKDKSAPNASQP